MASVFPNAASEFIYTRTYSRWVDEWQRRERWEETVERYIDFIEKHVGDRVPQKVFKKARQAILNMGVMPSMRALWTAGPAAEFDNTCMYNCSFQAVDCVEAFAECLYILMCGAGYGFSVENKYIKKLPEVPHMTGQGAGTFQIPDDKAGWADSVKKLMQALYRGEDLDLDYSLLRPKGARLQTMGGRSSGPEPLMRLHHFIRDVFQKAAGRKLTDIECHDIMCQIAEIVVVGGVRRSSEISLSDLESDAMARCKTGEFPVRRYMANNSAVYYVRPTAARFLTEWGILANSGSGERGLCNLLAARNMSPKRRIADLIAGFNPCAEILLRSCQFCNLTEIVVRAEDDMDDLLEKVETATWLGAIQSTFTFFPYLRKKWKKNCDEERLLGVSLTGQLDNPAVLKPDVLDALKAKALKVAKHAAKILQINVPTAVTCVKPSGTVSQLVDSASGMHARYSKFYIRRYRISSTDPLFQLLRDQGVPCSPDNGEREEDWEKEASSKGKAGCCKIWQAGQKWSEDKVSTWVVSFPIAAPKKCVVRDQLSALKQLEHYKNLREHWCEHNASCTVYVRDEEWFEVGNWIYQNWDLITGVSFLPYDGGTYEQAPYEEVSEERYNELVANFPKIDYGKLSEYEQADNTSGAKTYACTGDKCEISI